MVELLTLRAHCSLLASPSARSSRFLPITTSESTDPLQANNLVRAQSLAWSPDGTRLVSGGDSAVVWDARSGNMRTRYDRTYKDPQGDQLVLEQTTVAWSPDGQHVVSGGDQFDPATRNWTTAQIWDAANGHPVLNLFDPTPDSVAGRLYGVFWSPDGSQIATAGTGYAHRRGDLLATFQIWQAATGTLLFTRRGTASPSAVNSISWAPDNRRVVIGDVRGQAQVWDISSQRLLQTYHGHSHSISAVCWSPDGQWIASASSDTTAQVWDPQTGQTVYTYRGHSASVNALAWSPDSMYLTSGSDDQTVQVWRAH